MSHRYTVKSPLSASANGRHSHDDQGVPWQNTTAGPAPARPQAIRRPSHENVSPRSISGTVGHPTPRRSLLDGTPTPGVASLLELDRATCYELLGRARDRHQRARPA